MTEMYKGSYMTNGKWFNALNTISEKLIDFHKACLCTDYFDNDLSHKALMLKKERIIDDIINNRLIPYAEMKIAEDIQKTVEENKSLESQGLPANNPVKLQIARQNGFPVLNSAGTVICCYEALSPQICDFLHINRPTRSVTDGKTLYGKSIDFILDETVKMIEDFEKMNDEEFSRKYATPKEYTYAPSVFSIQQYLENTEDFWEKDLSSVNCYHRIREYGDMLTIMKQISEISNGNMEVGISNGKPYCMLKDNPYSKQEIAYCTIHCKYTKENNRFINTSTELSMTLDNNKSLIISQNVYSEHLRSEGKKAFDNYVEHFNNVIVDALLIRKEEEEKAQQKLCDYFYSLFEEPDNKKNEHNKEL